MEISVYFKGQAYGDPADTEELASLLGDNFNLVWKALSKGSSDSVEFKELMMSVAGSLIATKIEGGLSLKPLPSLIVDSSFLKNISVLKENQAG